MFVLFAIVWNLFIPLENILLVSSHHYRWRAANFDQRWHYFHWAVRILYCVTLIVSLDIRVCGLLLRPVSMGLAVGIHVRVGFRIPKHPHANETSTRLLGLYIQIVNFSYKMSKSLFTSWLDSWNMYYSRESNIKNQWRCFRV